MNELKISGSLNFTKYSTKHSASASAQITVDGDKPAEALEVAVSTVEGQISFSAITTPGYGMFVNLDTTYSIQLGAVSGQLGVKLSSGEFAMFRPSASAIYHQAEAAAGGIAPQLRYHVIDL